MAVVCTTAFFFHQNFISTPLPLKQEYNIYNTVKAKRSESLSAVKELSKHTKEYQIYLKYKKEADIAHANLSKAIENNKVYGFNNKRIFFGELDWAVGLLLYALFNLILSLIYKKETLFGEIIFHCDLIFIAIFYIRYCFLDSNDYETIEYYIFNLFCVVLILIATHLVIMGITKRNNKPLYRLVRWIVVSVRGKHIKNIGFTALNDKDSYDSTIKEIEDFETGFKIEVSKAINISIEDFESEKSNYPT